MSWSIEVTGTKAAVAEHITSRMDSLAERYGGLEESRDLLVVKDRLLALVEACDLTTDGFTTWNGVLVKASGSHYTTGIDAAAGNLASAQAQFSVVRVSLAL